MVESGQAANTDPHHHEFWITFVNKTDKNLMVAVDDTSVNDAACDVSSVFTIPPGKRTNNGIISAYETTLEEQWIEKIEYAGFSLHYDDNDDRVGGLRVEIEKPFVIPGQSLTKKVRTIGRKGGGSEGHVPQFAIVDFYARAVRLKSRWLIGLPCHLLPSLAAVAFRPLRVPSFPAVCTAETALVSPSIRHGRFLRSHGSLEISVAHWRTARFIPHSGRSPLPHRRIPSPVRMECLPLRFRGRAEGTAKITNPVRNVFRTEGDPEAIALPRRCIPCRQGCQTARTQPQICPRQAAPLPGHRLWSASCPARPHTAGLPAFERHRKRCLSSHHPASPEPMKNPGRGSCRASSPGAPLNSGRWRWCGIPQRLFHSLDGAHGCGRYSKLRRKRLL
jgi:hypothetical protein